MKAEAIVLISAGKGPDECGRVVYMVYKKIVKECAALNLYLRIIEKKTGRNVNTFDSIVLSIKGEIKKLHLEKWCGTIQWRCKSPFRPNHKRKNWFVGLSLLHLPDIVKINVSDVVFQTFKSSGPGGQHRNKVETAVRVKHKKTGLAVTATEAKSQHQNRQVALKKLEELIIEENLKNQRKRIEDQWTQHASLERGNAIRVYSGTEFKLSKN